MEDERVEAARQKLSILAVDDISEMDGTEAMLSRLCALDVRIARSSDEALQAVEEAWPDVVLLGVGTPAGSGYTLARAIRERCGERKLPYLIALSGQETPHDRRRAR